MAIEERWDRSFVMSLLTLGFSHERQYKNGKAKVSISQKKDAGSV